MLKNNCNSFNLTKSLLFHNTLFDIIYSKAKIGVFQKHYEWDFSKISLLENIEIINYTFLDLLDCNAF